MGSMGSDSVHLHFHLKSGDDMESESEPIDPIPTTTIGSLSTSGTPTTLLPVQPGKIEDMNRRGRYGRYGYGIGRYGSRRGNGGYGNGRARYGHGYRYGNKMVCHDCNPNCESCSC